MDKMKMAAHEALIGMQNDCNALMKLTQEERDSLSKSVAERMREIRNEALEEAAKLADSFGEKRTRQLGGLVSGAAHTIAQDLRTLALPAVVSEDK